MLDGERRFVMQLAEHLGYANPDRMLAEMSSRHFAEWEAHFELKAWEQENMKGR